MITNYGIICDHITFYLYGETIFVIATAFIDPFDYTGDLYDEQEYIHDKVEVVTEAPIPICVYHIVVISVCWWIKGIVKKATKELW